MKKVFILYTADAHLMTDSREFIGVYDSKAKAINDITQDLREVSKQTYKDKGYTKYTSMLDDLIDNLYSLNQTQTLSENYIIEEVTLNKLNK